MFACYLLNQAIVFYLEVGIVINPFLSAFNKMKWVGDLMKMRKITLGAKGLIFSLIRKGTWQTGEDSHFCFDIVKQISCFYSLIHNIHFWRSPLLWPWAQRLHGRACNLCSTNGDVPSILSLWTTNFFSTQLKLCLVCCWKLTLYPMLKWNI